MSTHAEPRQLEFDFPPSLAEGKKALEQMLFRAYFAELDDANPRIRRKGVKGLGELGAASRPALAKLESLLEDPDPKVRAAVEAALAKILADIRG